MHLVVNGLPQEVRYDAHGIDDLLLPRLREWIASTGGARRSFAFLAAPPGSGKSTLAALLEQALGPELQCVGMDGFHMSRAQLDGRTIERDGQVVPLASIKGAPETFDVQALDRMLTRAADEDVTWPRYDRTLHDVVPDGDRVTSQHVLVEGNWLLLDEPGWRELRRHASLTILVTAPEELLAGRLVARKVQGGSSPEQAQDFYQRSDGPNVRRALQDSSREGVDLLLTMDPQGFLHESDNQ